MKKMKKVKKVKKNNNNNNDGNNVVSASHLIEIKSTLLLYMYD